MKPFLISSAYGNYVSDEGDAIAREAYGANYDRLAALKTKYDRTNFFRMNHNIKPILTAVAKVKESGQPKRLYLFRATKNLS